MLNCKYILKLMLLVVFLLPLALTSCKSGGTSTITQFNPYQGVKGVTMELNDKTIPKTVFQNEQFNAFVKLQNEGAFNVTNGLFLIVIDPYYLTSLSSKEWTVNLTGKSYTDQKGAMDGYTFLLTANPIEGQRESPTTKVVFSLCYPYHTKFVSDVCLDSDPYSMDVRKKSCISKILTFSGQGAPVAVTQIEPRMSIKFDANNVSWVAPSFKITLKNLGQGMVMRPNASMGKLRDQCMQRQLTNEINITVRLFNDTLNCTPAVLRFDQGEAIAYCTSSYRNLTFVTQPDVLFVDTDYIYYETDTREIEVMR